MEPMGTGVGELDDSFESDARVFSSVDVDLSGCSKGPKCLNPKR